MDMDMSSATHPAHHWLSFSLSNNYHHGLLEALSSSSSAHQIAGKEANTPITISIMRTSEQASYTCVLPCEL